MTIMPPGPETRPLHLQSVLSEWYQTYREPLRGHIARLLSSRSPHLIDDVLQDVFLKTWRRLVAGSPIAEQKQAAAVRHYLYRVATNLCFDVLRRGKLIIWQPLSGDPLFEKSDEEGFLLDQYEDPSAQPPFEAVVALEALNKLRVEQRQALLLQAQGYSYEEIASEMKRSEVRMLLRRARKALVAEASQEPQVEKERDAR